jgi:segregation and condensation protein B
MKTLKQTLNSHFDNSFKEEEIISAIDELKEKFNDPQHSFEVIEIADGYQFMTKGAYYPLLSHHLRIESKRKLSKSALETLAIISYKQPVAKSSIEGIRGVNCDYAVQKLLEKELIEMVGRDEGPGRPLLYGTTTKFLNHFGLKNLKELPKLKEFEIEENTVGLKEEE